MKNKIFTKRKLNQSIMQFAILSVIILAVGAFYGYMHYTEYQAATTALTEGTAHLSELKASSDQAKMAYLTLKKDMESQNVGVNQAIEQILPSNEDFTDLARALDKYFLNTAATPNAMFLSDLRFASPVINDEKEFAVLPFTMSLSANETSFSTFLEYIENSGDLNDRTRLLDIASVNMSYQLPRSASSTGNATQPSVSTAVRDVSASLNLRAYFQKPIEDLIP
jgi:hypothetical protein